jgi:hypothetical protein
MSLVKLIFKSSDRIERACFAVHATLSDGERISEDRLPGSQSDRWDIDIGISHVAQQSNLQALEVGDNRSRQIDTECHTQEDICCHCILQLRLLQARAIVQTRG